MNDETKAYHLYLLLCDDRVLYTGVTTDPASRLKQHRQGAPYGAKFTRGFEKLEMVYHIKVGEKVLAYQLEYRIKRWSKKKKQQLIKDQPDKAELIAAAGLLPS